MNDEFKRENTLSAAAKEGCTNSVDLAADNHTGNWVAWILKKGKAESVSIIYIVGFSIWTLLGENNLAALKATRGAFILDDTNLFATASTFGV